MSKLPAQAIFKDFYELNKLLVAPLHYYLMFYGMGMGNNIANLILKVRQYARFAQDGGDVWFDVPIETLYNDSQCRVDAGTGGPVPVFNWANLRPGFLYAPPVIAFTRQGPYYLPNAGDIIFTWGPPEATDTVTVHLPSGLKTALDIATLINTALMAHGCAICAFNAENGLMLIWQIVVGDDDYGGILTVSGDAEILSILGLAAGTYFGNNDPYYEVCSMELLRSDSQEGLANFIVPVVDPTKTPLIGAPIGGGDWGKAVIWGGIPG